MTDESTDDDFYKLFDELSNEGKVYTFDLSSVENLPVEELLVDESNERRNWKEKWLNVQAGYSQVPTIRTTDEYLTQRVLIPCLADGKKKAISPRTDIQEERSDSQYPDTIFQWEEFKQNVKEFNPENRNLVRSPNHNFTYTKGNPRRPLQNEKQETSYLTDRLEGLMENGLFSTFEETGFKNGEPDWWTTDSNGAILMVVVMKSTHNLLLPMTADRIVQIYNERGHDRSKRLRHIIGQVVAYMVANKIRYGAISSGTRSYFVCIHQDEQSKREVLQISDAWFIGQKNFLRAWAYMNHIANTTEKVPWNRIGSDGPDAMKVLWETVHLYTASTSTSNNEGDRFYEFFDQLSNGGRVYDLDLSAVVGPVPSDRLLREEIDQRRVWMERWTQVQTEYDRIGVPRISTTDEFLSQRILIPCLSSGSVSSRTKLTEQRANYDYANEIVEWEEFEQNVTAFQPENRRIRSPIHNFMDTYGDPGGPLQNETQETSYLTLRLRGLRLIGLFSAVHETGFKNGEPDWWTVDSNGAILMVVVMKATHDLPLPMTADRIVQLYNERGDDRSKRLHHPIGQLVAYMIANQSRYGAISSGTRSYFVCIHQDEQSKQEVLQISNAWFIGQKNFLRAWAYMNHIANTTEKVPLTTTTNIYTNMTRVLWQTRNDTVSQGKRPREGTPEGDSKPTSRPGSRSMKKEEWHLHQNSNDRTPEVSTGLPQISDRDFDIIKPLGSGRNGTVYLARWQGHDIALKQFDMSKNAKYYEKELAAYQHLKSAWGSLVITPLFVSKHWYGWIKYIGLQLGRSPNEDDDADSFWEENEKVLETLEKEYKFRHEDADEGQNMVYIWDEKTKSERLVAIDLEWYTILE